MRLKLADGGAVNLSFFIVFSLPRCSDAAGVPPYGWLRTFRGGDVDRCKAEEGSVARATLTDDNAAGGGISTTE